MGRNPYQILLESGLCSSVAGGTSAHSKLTFTKTSLEEGLAIAVRWRGENQNPHVILRGLLKHISFWGKPA